MLVLLRKKDQKVLIYEGEKLLVEVAVVDVRGKKVKLGFTAPKEITIDREEVFESKRMTADMMKRDLTNRVERKGTA